MRICLTPLSTIFQLYRDGYFIVILVEETRVPGENTDLSHVTDKLYHIVLSTPRHEQASNLHR
jgi:hypothetical protein